MTLPGARRGAPSVLRERGRGEAASAGRGGLVMRYPLDGRVAIVTGGSHGLGRRIAELFLDSGATTVLCARDGGPLDHARAELERRASASAGVETIVADVSVPEDSDRVVSHALRRFGRVDVLVNNAGILGPLGGVEEVDWREWVRAVHVDLFGSVLMARAVLPAMKARRTGKIIQLSGGGATGPRPRVSAYAAAKAAVVRFAETLAEEVRDFGIEVNSVAPGALDTRMLDEVLVAGPEKVGRAAFDQAVKQKEKGGDAMEAAAALVAFLASAESDGITGKLISAVWDDWASWPAHLDELGSSDAYTLRRIAGRDRGLPWGDR